MEPNIEDGFGCGLHSKNYKSNPCYSQYVIPKPIDQITKEDIDSLLVAKVPEGRALDYKAQLNANTDKEKVEFLSDVSSFANAADGDMIFGISDERDSSGKPTGLPSSVEGIPLVNASEVRLRLENLIRDGIDPRIPGIQWKEVAGFPKGPVLVMRIPKSWFGPHMVTFGGLSRFYSRNSAGKYPLDLGEIRSAFLAQAAVGERIKRFVLERVLKAVQGESPVPLPDTRILLHLIPLSALDPTSLRDVSKTAVRLSIDLQPMDVGGWGTRFNFDGVLAFSSGDYNKSYVQVFRSGIIEAADAEMFKYERSIPTLQFESNLWHASTRYLLAQKKLGLPLPIFVVITLVGVKGFKLSVNQWILMQLTNGPVPVDRDILQLPEIMIEDYDVDFSNILRPAFDALWQACGLQQSFNYDQTGNWNPKR